MSKLCPKCNRLLEQRPVQYVLRRGEHYFGFDGVSVHICSACDWRTVSQTDLDVMRRAIDTDVMAAKGMLNVPLFAFAEAKRAVEENTPVNEFSSGLVEDAPHSDLTGQVIGWAMDVHNEHGPGHEEAVYQRALAARMSQGQRVFEEEPNLVIEEKDGVLVGLYRPDFIVEDVVVVEIKTHTWPLTDDEVAQVIDYFAGTTCNVALLFNFGQPRLKWRRLFPPKHIQEHRRKRWGKPLR